jgi:hypothetical protein
MPQEARRPIKCLVFGASLRHGSFNNRLANLAADVVEQQGATVDRAEMRDFECPPYDGDVEQSQGLPHTLHVTCAGESRSRTRSSSRRPSTTRRCRDT